MNLGAQTGHQASLQREVNISAKNKKIVVAITYKILETK